MTQWSRGWFGFCTVLLLLGVMGEVFSARIQAAEALPKPAEILKRMIDQARLEALAAKEAPPTFEKQTRIEQLDAQGKVTKTEQKLHQVKLVAGLPISRLVKIQGRDLSADELRAEEKKEERIRQKLMSVEVRKMAARKEALVTRELLDRFEFEVKERMVVSNRTTLALTFKPKGGALPERTIRDRLLNKFAGTVWIDEADAVPVRLTVGLVEPVSIGWFGVLGSLSQCDLALERRRLPDGLWMNARQVLLIHYRKLTTTKRLRITEEDRVKSGG
jgi:hypothetical protein